MGASARLWDVFCRVVDNLGDVGVCWRLACGLAERGERVRLWIDDPRALPWMAPEGREGVMVLPWGPQWEERVEPGHIVVEAFGCHPPDPFVARMASRPHPPAWINLEHLSAESYVERCHRLPSPQSLGPGRGLTKWFFFPGFSAGTGGLLRETGLLEARAHFDRLAWLAARGLSPRQEPGGGASGKGGGSAGGATSGAAGERVCLLFCYDNPALPAWLAALGQLPTLLLLTPGPATQQVRRIGLPAQVRAVELPWLSQPEFDRLLWCADLNMVRGEDSLVRAIWAGAPFLWQAYMQEDGAHAAKVEALLEAMQADEAVARAFRQWNGLEDCLGSLPGNSRENGPKPQGAGFALPPLAPWGRRLRAWRASLAAQPDLVSQLLEFDPVRGTGAG